MALTIQNFQNAIQGHGKVTLDRQQGQDALVGGSHSVFGHKVKRLGANAAAREPAKVQNRMTILAFTSAIHRERGPHAAKLAGQVLDARMRAGRPLSKTAIRKALDFTQNFRLNLGKTFTDSMSRSHLNERQALLTQDLVNLGNPTGPRHTTVELPTGNVRMTQQFRADMTRFKTQIGDNAMLPHNSGEEGLRTATQQLKDLTGNNAWAMRDLSHLLSQNTQNAVCMLDVDRDGFKAGFPFPGLPFGGENAQTSHYKVERNGDDYKVTFVQNARPHTLRTDLTANGVVYLDPRQSAFDLVVTLNYRPHPDGNGPGTVSNLNANYRVHLTEGDG